jgi:hypothetical protein
VSERERASVSERARAEVGRPSTRGRGFALAAARALGADAPSFCRARAPAAGGPTEAIARHAETLVDEAARAREAEDIGRTVPLGIERADRSWYIAPPGSRSRAAEVHLARAAFARLVSMDDGGASDGDDDVATMALARATPAGLERALMALGRRRVALAFIGAPRVGLAQLCARVGEPAASELLAEVRALKAATPSPDDVKAAQRALFRNDDGELRGDGGGLDEAHAFFFRIGAAWLAPALLHTGDRLRRAAQQLPRPLGQTLLDEAAAPSTEGERRVALEQLVIALEHGP